MEKKSDYHFLCVKEDRGLKVVFDRPLTEEEAIKAYNRGDYDDIMDEETYDSEAYSSELMGSD